MSDYLELLSDQVHHDMMACIGCNDCLMACPLPESRNVTIAELNHGVLAEQITAQNVVDFVTRCTQCQQCVPACPADLRRADIVLWNKMKVERDTPNRVLPLQAGEHVVDSQWTVDALAQRLAKLTLFEGVDPVMLRGILLSVTIRRLGPGDVLVEAGDYHERLLVVLEGALEQTAGDHAGANIRILMLGPGSFHGYMAVMSNVREPFTISAVGESTIVEFTKASVVRLMKEASSFDQTMQTLYARNAVWNQTRSSPMFALLPEDEMEQLLNQAAFRVLTAGEILYKEGDHPSDMYIVRGGFLRVARRFGDKERVLQYFRDGDVAGASALIFVTAQSTTVSANTRSEVIQIPGKAIRELLGRRPDLREELAQAAQRSEQFLNESTKRPETPKANPTAHMTSIEGLLEEGVIQGHHVLMINTAICTNCGNCVDACERRHGFSRLDRSGLQMGDLLFPTACRHCEDPKCLLCSVSGIVREPNGEIRIHPENCIGCGACAERCPYGNINLHDRDERSKGPIDRVLSLLRNDESHDDIHQANEKGNRVAVKCDLCAGYDNYACVRGCPVGAAMRADPVELFGRSDLLIGLETDRPHGIETPGKAKT